jgi:hypothetical protein
VDRLDDPIDARISTDGFVLWVHKNDFEVLVRRVLIDPVGVQNSQVGTTASDTFFSGGLKGALVFQLVDSLVGWFACITTASVSAATLH